MKQGLKKTVMEEKSFKESCSSFDSFDAQQIVTRQLF